jgi:hypothetical protein
MVSEAEWPGAPGAAWAQRVHEALKADHPALAARAPEPMDDKGLAHWHFRLPGTGCIARVPKQSQMDLPVAMNLSYQAACFRRAAESGHTPHLHGVLPPSDLLPWGALLVEEIVGKPAQLPADLNAIMDALAAIHALPLPGSDRRSPLLDPVDPFQALLREIERQGVHLDNAGLTSAGRAGIDAVHARVHAVMQGIAVWPKGLIAFDAHPGNFLIRDDGEAVLVDLEKARYGIASLDVAHATLVTSTTWDIKSSAELSAQEVIDAYWRWSLALGAERAGHARDWIHTRAAMWLWSVTWCAKWRALSVRSQRQTIDGEDWSSTMSEQRLSSHVRGRVEDYLSPQRVIFVLDELDTLGRALSV